MTRDVNFDIINDYSKLEYSVFNPSELVNMFIVTHPLGKKQKAAYPTPGLGSSVFVAGVSGAGRALFTFKGNMYAVIGNGFYSFNNSLHYNLINTINTSTGHIGYTTNDNQILIVDGTGGWVYDVRDKSFTRITSVDFPSDPKDVTVLANRAIANSNSTKEQRFSKNGDFSVWEANNEFAITSYPDVGVANATINGKLFLMGRISTEPWFDAGSPIVPYRRESIAYEFGCAAASSVAAGFGVLVWLSNTDQGVGAIVATTGAKPEAISDETIETEIEKYASVSDCSAYIYKNEIGHIMYVINFTSVNTSWMYDFKNKAWSKLTYNSVDRHLGQKHTYFNGKHYVVSYLDSKVYELSNRFNDDDGVSIRRSIVTPVYSEPSYRDITINEFSVDMMQGTGLDGANNDVSPKLFLSTSSDGGISYGNQIKSDLGKIGARRYKTRFNNLGCNNQWVMRLEHFNNSKLVVLGASANITVAREAE